MDRETEWICPICLNARGLLAYASPCRHEFCLVCILHWVEMNPQCPRCGQPVEMVSLPGQGEDNALNFFRRREAAPDANRQEGSAPVNPAENIPHHAVASRPSSPQGIPAPAEQQAAVTDTMGGFPPQVWAELFQRYAYLLDSVLPLLHQWLEEIHETRWWRVNCAVGSILYALCVCGPDEEAMVQMLQPSLREHTAQLVHDVVNTIVQQCSEEAQRLLQPRAAVQGEESPVASSSSSSSVLPRSSSTSSSLSSSSLSSTSSSSTSSSSTSSSSSSSTSFLSTSSSLSSSSSTSSLSTSSSLSSSSSTSSLSTSPSLSRSSSTSSLSNGSSSSRSSREISASSLASSSSTAGSSGEEEEPGTSEAALRRSPSQSPRAPVPAEQEQPQEEPGQAAAAPAPSAQACSRSTSTRGRDRAHSPAEPRRSRRRRAPSPQEGPQPCKRSARRRH